MKCWSISTKNHGATSQKPVTFIFAGVRTWNPTNSCKATLFRYTPWRRLGERKYSSYSFLTSALDGVSGQHHTTAALSPGEKTPVIHCIRGFSNAVTFLYKGKHPPQQRWRRTCHRTLQLSPSQVSKPSWWTEAKGSWTLASGCTSPCCTMQSLFPRSADIRNINIHNALVI
jgi:hypothetical protein